MSHTANFGTWKSALLSRFAPAVSTGVDSISLKFAVKIGVFALAMLLSAAPTMVCLLPIALTPAEQECCKRMAPECGGATMPRSHSCCKRLIEPEDSFIKASGAQLDHIASSTYAPPVGVPLPATSAPLIHLASDLGVHGPPGSPPRTISVLRI